MGRCKSGHIQKSWENIIQINKSNNQQKENDDSIVDLTYLSNQLPVKQPIGNDNVIGAIGDMVLNIINREEEDTSPTISHSDGLQAIEAAFAYVEQQEE